METQPAQHTVTPQDKSLYVAGHFGELLQGTLGPNGPVVLVTLPCQQVGVFARHDPALPFGFHGKQSAEDLSVPLRTLFSALNLPIQGGFVIRSIMEAGLGTGVSTACLVAAARLAGWQGDPMDLARACVESEGASDPLMIPHPERLLWASRLGKPIETYSSPPEFEVLGGFFGPPLRTDANDNRYADISDLIEGWRKAQTLAEFAQLASESAARNLTLRGLADDPTCDLAKELGALGWQISYSGAARGLIFAPGTIPQGAERHIETKGLRHVVRFGTGPTS